MASVSASGVETLLGQLDASVNKHAMSPSHSLSSPSLADSRPGDRAMSVDVSDTDRSDTDQSPSSGTSDRSDEMMHDKEKEVRRTRTYSLRQSSIINRIETEKRQSQPKQPKPKNKPPPLSKYRRRTANARERGRMQEINDAFEALRDAIPNYPQEKNNKLTKITTLRLAMNYIRALQDMLDESQEQPADTMTNSNGLETTETMDLGSDFLASPDSGIGESLSSPSLSSPPHSSPSTSPDCGLGLFTSIPQAPPPPYPHSSLPSLLQDYIMS